MIKDIPHLIVSGQLAKNRLITNGDVTMATELQIKAEGTAPLSADSAGLMRIIDKAAQSPDFDVAKLSALLDVKERWEQAEARKAYVAAITLFKANAPQIIKDKEVSFGAGKTAYKHATLDKASEQIGHALADYGLSHSWSVEQKDGGLISVTCVLTHSMGHSERVSMQATPDTSGSKNSIQAIGSTVSYLQRYTLFAATGLAPKGADDDAQGGIGNKMPEKQRADFEAEIQTITDLQSWEKLWALILAASKASGDVETHEALRALMAAKRRGLK